MIRSRSAAARVSYSATNAAAATSVSVAYIAITPLWGERQPGPAVGAVERAGGGGRGRRGRGGAGREQTGGGEDAQELAAVGVVDLGEHGGPSVGCISTRSSEDSQPYFSVERGPAQAAQSAA